MLEKFNKFIEYWWFRYLLATELYIVEKWERVTMRKYDKTKSAFSPHFIRTFMHYFALFYFKYDFRCYTVAAISASRLF